MTDRSNSLDVDVLQRHTGFVRALAARLVDDASLADDLTQETMLAALEHPPRRAQSLRAWLASTVRNLASSEYRARSRRMKREHAAARSERTPSGFDSLAEIEVLGKLVEALRALSESNREAIVLRYLEGLPPREIAKRLDVPVETVKKRLQRALDDLRKRLDDSHDGDRRAWCATFACFGAASKSAALVASGGSAIEGAMALSGKAKLAAAIAVLFVGWFAWWSVIRDGNPPGIEDESTFEIATSSSNDEPPGRPDAPPPESGGGALEGGTLVARSVLPDLEVDRDLDLFGIVVDTDGEPIAGATVDALQVYDWRAEQYRGFDLERAFSRETVTSTVSREDGQFALRLSWGEVVELRASAEGFGDATLEFRTAGEQVRVVLAAPAVLEVRVVDEAGAPVPDATVRTWCNNDRSDAFEFRAKATSSDGVAVFESLPPGGRRLLGAYHTVLADSEWEFPVMEAGARQVVELTLPAGRTVRGRVVDAETDEPIQNARVGIMPWLAHEDRTDADGRFEILGFRNPGRDAQVLFVEAEGYEGERFRPPPDGEATVALKRGDVATGRVVSSTGEPLADARIFAVGISITRGGDYTNRSRTSSGVDGRFELNDLRHGIPHALIVLADGYGRGVLDFEIRKFERRIDVGDIVLFEERRIEGFVRNEDGEPVARRLVGLDGPAVVDPAPRHRNRIEYVGERFDRTDDLGRFRFRGLAPGDYRLSLDEEFEPSLSVTVAPDADPPPIELRAGVGPGERSLTVRVEDEQGNPIPNVAVELDDGAARATDDRGEARFELVSPGVRRVTAQATGYWPESATESLEPDDVEVVFRLQPASTITGRVVDANGVPAANTSLVVMHSYNGRYLGFPTNDRGEFVVKVPECDVVTLRTGGSGDERPGWRETTYEITPPAEGVELVAERITYDRTLDVRYLDVDGSPVPGMTLVAEGGSGFRGFYDTVPTGADGRAYFRDLPDHDVRIRIDGERYPPPGWEVRPGVRPIESIEVVPVGQEIELRFRQFGFIEGTIVDAEGEPPPAMIKVWAIDTETHERFDIYARPGILRHSVPVGRRYDLEASWTDAEGRTVEARLESVPCPSDGIVLRGVPR